MPLLKEGDLELQREEEMQGAYMCVAMGRTEILDLRTTCPIATETSGRTSRKILISSLPGLLSVGPVYILVLLRSDVKNIEFT